MVDKLLQWIYRLDAWLSSWEQAYRQRNMEENDTVNAPVSTTEVTQMVPPENLFTRFCAYIIQYEGANPANNNPFDFRYYFGGYLPKYGVVKESSGGFAMFETYQLGYEYGSICITEMIHNHPEWDFLDFFARFAPKDDHNDPVRYAKTIAGWLGTVATENVKTFLKL